MVTIGLDPGAVFTLAVEELVASDRSRYLLRNLESQSGELPVTIDRLERPLLF